MKLNHHFSALLVSISILGLPTLPALSQQASSDLNKLQSLLQSQKWDEANQETISLVRNNSQTLSCPNISAINELWMNNSNKKFGFTPQFQIWQQVGGDKCKTCEGEIKKFSKQVGWNLSDQIGTLPGDYVWQYPTVASLGWQRYVDSGRNFWYGDHHTWQAYKVGDFNFFSVLKNSPGNTSK